MRWTWWGVPALLALTGGGGSAACSYAQCALGTFPLHGATNVDPDVILELRTFELPNNFPSLDGAVLLEHDGAEVSVDIVVDPESQTVFVTPLEPLVEGEYRLRGVQAPQAGHWYNGFGPVAARADVRFEVGGMPRFRGAGLVDDGNTLLLSFSEPVQADTVQGALAVEGELGFVVVGHYSDEPSAVEVHLTVPQSVLELSLGEGVLADDGTPVAPTDKPLVVDDYDGFVITNLYAGEAHCGG